LKGDISNSLLLSKSTINADPSTDYWPCDIKFPSGFILFVSIILGKCSDWVHLSYKEIWPKLNLNLVIPDPIYIL
jgi:hypothetical protein